MSLSQPLPLSRRALYTWVYTGRSVTVLGVLIWTVLSWWSGTVGAAGLPAIMGLFALSVTAASVWFTHGRGRDGGETFAYGQVVFDMLLVTSIVHATGGGQSSFAFLYILVISSGALLLPLAGGVLIGLFTSIVYFADSLVVSGGTFSGGVLLQIALFAVVALATGWVGDRLRSARLALGAAESELQRLRLDTSDILDSIGSGIITIDREERLLYLNRAGHRLLGVDSSQWLGRQVVDEVAEVSPQLTKILRRTLSDMRPMDRSKAVASRNGRSMTLGVSTTVLERAGGPPESVTAIFQDITSHERLRSLLRRAERLEAVAELSASLAHEIKNPLASIRSAVEQLAGEDTSSDDGEVLRNLVVRESDRVSRLLSEFIDFSSLRLGVMDEVDLTEIVSDCVEVARRHPSKGEGVEIHVTGVDESVVLVGDRDLLHRAIFNLVLNAVQFSPVDGVVSVDVARLAASVGSEEVQPDLPVRVAVRDSGPGVRAEDLPRIFDPFYTTRHGGNGLGLSVVQRSISAHGGAVFVEPVAGGGAEFIVCLPETASGEEALWAK